MPSLSQVNRARGFERVRSRLGELRTRVRAVHKEILSPAESELADCLEETLGLVGDVARLAEGDAC